MSARTAVLLHGVMASGATWWRIAPALRERGFEVLTPDLPGHGGRPAPDPATLETLADGVQDALPERVDLLVGHSLGALVALVLAARRPGAVGALLLEDPPGTDGIDREALAAGVLADAEAARRDRNALVRREAAGNPRWEPGDAERSVDGILGTDAEAVAAAVRSSLRWDLPALLGAVPVPVTLLAATERRGPYPQEPGTALRGRDREAVRAALGGGFRVLDGGHCLHRDDPEAWLAALGAAEAG